MVDKLYTLQQIIDMLDEHYPDDRGGVIAKSLVQDGMPCVASQPDAAAIRRKALEEAEIALLAAGYTHAHEVLHALAQAPQEQQEQAVSLDAWSDPVSASGWDTAPVAQQAGQPAPVVQMTDEREAIESLLGSVESLMAWCVKNVNQWDFPQYDYVTRDVEKVRAMINAAPAQEGKTK